MRAVFEFLYWCFALAVLAVFAAWFLPWGYVRGVDYRLLYLGLVHFAVLVLSLGWFYHSRIKKIIFNE